MSRAFGVLGLLVFAVVAGCSGKTHDTQSTATHSAAVTTDGGADAAVDFTQEKYLAAASCADCTVLHSSRLQLPETGIVAASAKLRAPDGTVRAITINATGATVDEPTLLANERAAARAKYGKLSPELLAWTKTALPSDRRWVWVWTDVSIEYPRREDLSTAAALSAFRTQVASALDTSVKPVRDFLATEAGVEFGDASGPIVRARLTAAQVKKVAALARVGQIGVDLYPGTPASTPWGSASQWGASIRLPQAHTAYGIGSSSIKVCVEEQHRAKTAFDSVVVAATQNSEPPTNTAHADGVVGLIKNLDATTPKNCVAPGVSLYVANWNTGTVRSADDWCRVTVGATQINYSNDLGGNLQTGLSGVDVAHDWMAKISPFPLVAAAAGHPDTVDPTTYHYVGNRGLNGLVVGGVDDRNTADRSDDLHASTSAWGNPATTHGDYELPHVVAPSNGSTVGGVDISGTSASTAMVSGLSALLESQHSSFATWPEMKRAVIIATATGRANQGAFTSLTSTPSDYIGAGEIDAYQATQLGAGSNVVASGGYATATHGRTAFTMKLNADFNSNGYLKWAWKTNVTTSGRLRAAIAWDSTASCGSTTCSGDVLDGDLDLIVFRKTGTSDTSWTPTGTVACTSVTYDSPYEVCDIPVVAGEQYLFAVHEPSYTANNTYFSIAWFQYQQPSGAPCAAAGECASGSCTANKCGCSTDAQCPDRACVAGQCATANANGAACTAGSGCASGNCVDGVCCDTACTGTCQACTAAKRGSGTNGTCGAIGDGLNPDAECAAQSCTGGVMTNAQTCNGAGACRSNGTTACGVYACSGSSCGTTCTTDAQCSSTSYCAAGSCVAKKALGATCDGATQCGSGFCADGVCCNTSCGAQCAACDVVGSVGTCSAVTGAAHGTRTACAGSGACGSSCDGTNVNACAYPATGTACSDGNACNGAETCNGSGTCTSGTAPTIDDGKPCTADSCDPITGVAHTNVAAGTACADANACNGAETCNGSGACVAGTPPVVDDGNPCTADSCNAATGVAHTPVAAGTSCTDGNACNGAETCNATGACVAGTAPALDDSNPCTTDSCNPTTGVAHTAVAAGTSCSDGNTCNGAETCNASATCVAGTAPTVDDSNPCTTDSCDPATGVQHSPVAAGTSCTDGNACNGAETCNATGTCTAGTAPSLDDGNACTTDACNPASGPTHTAVAVGTSCTDGNACNGAETCNASGTCVAGTAPTLDDSNPCTADACDATAGVTHTPVAAGTSCADSTVCNGAETCDATGTCNSGTPLVTDDGNPCTTDSCNPTTGVAHTPVAVSTSCSDGDACNGLETCNASGVCAAGTAPTVDDGNPCTIDGCNSTTGVTHTNAAAGASCTDANACNGAETCDGAGACVSGTPPTLDDGNPCTTDVCDATAGVTHVQLATGTSCSDGNACNGAEVCNDTGSCISGTAPTLDDGNACTADACDPTAGVSHTNVGAGTSCADGNACNGAETCNGTGTCVAGTPIAIDDGNVCTTDACDPATGAVTHTPVTSGPCTDGIAPTWPTGSTLTASPSTPTRVSLSWTAATDNIAVAGYRLYRGGVLLASFPPSTTAFDDNSVTTGSTYTYQVQAFDVAGNASLDGPTATSQPLPELVPSTINRTVVTDIAASTEFLWKGPNKVQQGVADGTIEVARAAVLRGKVVTRDGAPLGGVEITVLNHVELGKTFSRADGLWDMAINGGGTLVVNYRKAGYALARRDISPAYRDFAALPDVALVPFDTAVTELDVTAGSTTMQVAQATIQTDSSGTRHATLMMPAGTTAAVVLPGGGTSAPSAIHFRATEYTVGPNGLAAMPAALPPNSAYTYALELSTDEARALGSEMTTLSQPALLYVENFLGFPVGGNVPLGSYRYNQNAWVAEPNGKVIKILSVSGGQAQLDSNGDGVADSLLDFTSEERQNLASIYPVGTSLWRMKVGHFSSWDANWGIAPPAGAKNPVASKPKPPTLSCPASATGSIIHCENQVLAEQMGVAGTPHTLRYQSDRVPGRTAENEITLQLTPATLPGPVKRVELTVAIAGRTIKSTYAATPNLSTTFVWDGKDAYGRTLQGLQRASVTIEYVYDGVYESVPEFGYTGGGAIILGVPGRSELKFPEGMLVSLGALDARELGLGGWMLENHHVYDSTSGTLFFGSGMRRDSSVAGSLVGTTLWEGGVGGSGFSAGGISAAADGTVYFYWGNDRIYSVPRDGGAATLIAGGGSSTAEGVLATNAYLFGTRLVVGPDGLVYFASNYRIRRIEADGTVRTLAGFEGAQGGYSTSPLGDGGPATSAYLLMHSPDFAFGPDGSMFIADYYGVRRIDPKGVITLVPGTGTSAYGERTELATAIAVAPDGTIYVGANTHAVGAVVRKVEPQGKVSIVAGVSVVGGGRGTAGEGGPATLAQLRAPTALALERDGTLLVGDADPSGFGNARILAVSPDGILRRYAGAGRSFTEGAPALQTWLLAVPGLAVQSDGTVLCWVHNRLQKIAPLMPGARGAEMVVASGSGNQAYVFNSAGRHLRTVDTLTNVNLWTFGYDTAGRLATIGDVDGNVTSVERDASGKPAALVGPYGQRTVVTVDANGFLDSIKDPALATTAFAYSAAGLMATMTDARSKTWTFTFDGKGRLTRDDDPAGGFKTLTPTFTGNNWEVDLSTKLGVTRKYKVERFGDGSEKRTFTAPSGLVTTALTDAAASTTNTQPTGMVSAVTAAPDPRFGMSAPLHSSTTTTPAGIVSTRSSSRSATLATAGNPFSLTSLQEQTLVNGGSGTADGGTFTSAFNALTRTWTFTSATTPARTSLLTLDADSHVTQTKFASFTAVDYGYDGRGRLTSITQGSRVTTFAYSPTTGFLESVTDPLLRTTTFQHDAVGRVTKQILPDTREVSMSYDAVGNLSSVTPPSRPAHVMTYSPVSLMATYEPPVVTGVSAPSTGYEYDFDRRLKKITRPDGVVVDYTYDTAGRRKTVSHPKDTVTFGYDATKGTLTSVSTPSVAVAHSYDGALRTGTAWSGAIAGSVGHTFDNRLRVSGETVNGGSAVSFGYDRDSLLTSAGALTLVRGSHGLVTDTTLGVITETLTYTPLGELESRTTKVSGTDLLKVTYARDALGRIETKTEIEGGVTKVFGYHYDTVGRLDEVKKDGVVTATYEYDANGNRKKKIRPGGTEEGTYDDQDRMLTYAGASYAYNANGDLTSKTDGSGTTTYEYDALGSLRKVTPSSGPVVDYVIDGANRRVGKKVGGTLTTQYVYSSDLRIIAELNGAGAVVSRYVYGTRVNVPEYIVKGGNTYRVVTDHLGSVRRVVDTSSGAVVQAIEYDEFGLVLSDSAPGSQLFGFAGGLVDGATGLVRFGARDYEARAGRWTNKDPIRFGGGDTNLYGYVLTDPVNFNDPRGLLISAAAAVAAEAATLATPVAGASFSPVAGAMAVASIPWAAGIIEPGLGEETAGVPDDDSGPVEDSADDDADGGVCMDEALESSRRTGKCARRLNNVCIPRCSAVWLPDPDLQSANFQRCMHECMGEVGCSY